jgi:hypothetical protein
MEATATAEAAATVEAAAAVATPSLRINCTAGHYCRAAH